jgi:hypothetical protein
MPTGAMPSRQAARQFYYQGSEPITKVVILLSPSLVKVLRVRDGKDG